jgi:hypothetical protein
VTTKYHYAIVHDAHLAGCATLVPRHSTPDAYVSNSPEVQKVRALLDQGYRWIRTEKGEAILELAIEEA